MSLLKNITEILAKWKVNNFQKYNIRWFSSNSEIRKQLFDTDEEDEEIWVDAFDKCRPEKIDVDTSIRYLDSEAFKKSYGDQLIWTLYRRNLGHNRFKDTRRSCFKKGVIATGSPCPICRDMYLVLHERNIKLLQQFISPFSGEIYPTRRTGLCQKQHTNLLVSIMRARSSGLLPDSVTFLNYDYKYYQSLSSQIVEEYKKKKD